MECTLMPPIREGYCHWCGRALPPRRRRWCMDECGAEYSRQHDWSKARVLTILRQHGVCQRCGVKTRLPYRWEWQGHPEYPWPGRGTRLEDERLWGNFYKKYVLPVIPEVNHIVPVNGGGYGFGCMNHADNLEVLCHSCHVKVTKEQRALRRLRQADEYARKNGMSA